MAGGEAHAHGGLQMTGFQKNV